VFVVEHNQRIGDDVADAPGAAAPAAQCLEAGREQGVGALTQGAQGAVDGVVGLLIRGELAARGFLDRYAQQAGLALLGER
jgi:hypothetical protein